MTNFTSQQQDFIKECSSGDSSIRLESCAGSGKTTTMVEAVNQMPQGQSILCCAFNKRIADELSSRMPSSVECRTLNALGHRAWGKNINKRCAVDTSKTYNIAKETKTLWACPDLTKLVGLCKTHGILPGKWGERNRGLWPDDRTSYDHIIDEFDLDMGETKIDLAIEEARRILDKSIKQAYEGLIDFDDQLYMPTCFGAPFEKKDVVFIDEAQDISKIQRKMLRKALKKSGRLMAIGDSRQAIYGFRGADSSSMEMIAQEFECETMHLTVSFRCPQRVVEEAQIYVGKDVIQAADGAPEGSVEAIGKWNGNLKSLIRPNSGIICRNNKSLVIFAFKLLREDIGCTILGRDFAKGLKAIVNKVVKSTGSQELPRFYEGLEAWRKREKEAALIKENYGKASLIDDKAESLWIIAENCGGKTTQDISFKIDMMFSEKKELITLATGHKSKGLEWPNVFHLDSFLIPSKYSSRAWQFEQENNLAYVITTRAIENLRFINLHDQEEQ